MEKYCRILFEVSRLEAVELLFETVVGAAAVAGI